MGAVQIERRSVYGVPRLYVVSEPHRAALARLTGKRTLTDGDVRALEELGVEVVARDVVP